jgi:hypothetical protein
MVMVSPSHPYNAGRAGCGWMRGWLRRNVYVAYIGGVVGGEGVEGGGGWCVCVSVCGGGRGGRGGFCETLRNTSGYVVFKTIISNLLEAFKNDYCYRRDLCRPSIYIWGRF